MPHRRYHATEHQDGGVDEINVGGLSGVLADRQDANKLQGRDIQDVAPNDDDVLTWNNTNSRWEPQAASGVCFGTEYNQAESDGTSVSTGTTWAQKVNLSVSSLPSGTYRIGWYYEFNCSASNAQFEGRVQLDDTTDLAMINTRISPATGYASSYGHKHVEVTTGSVSVDIDFRCSANKEVAIRRARLEIWRVC